MYVLNANMTLELYTHTLHFTVEVLHVSHEKTDRRVEAQNDDGKTELCADVVPTVGRQESKLILEIPWESGIETSFWG